MTLAGILGLVAFALLSADCSGSTARCERDATCYRCAGQECSVGLCIPAPAGPRYCAYTDTTCPTGLRWDPSTDDGLGNACVTNPPDMLTADGAPGGDGGG